jgi:hypothetical protein
MRRLLVCTRYVPADKWEPYGVLWKALVEAVRAAEGRAWRFTSARDSARHVEFIEWTGAPESLPERPDLARARNRLDSAFPETSRELLNESPS